MPAFSFRQNRAANWLQSSTSGNRGFEGNDWKRSGVNYIVLACAAFVLLTTTIMYSQKSKKQKEPTDSVTWDINNLDKICGHQTTVIGDPIVIRVPGGRAVLFDGVNDGLLVNSNPLAGAKTFTIEAVFRPDAGGDHEQRWFHIQEETGDDRVLLETRLDGNQWFTDTFIKSGEHSLALYAENFKHPVGEWYHVALAYDGSMMRHYVNGKEELSGPLSIPPLEEGKTSIGVRMNRMYWFKGAVRRARFTQRALAPEEFMGKE